VPLIKTRWKSTVGKRPSSRCQGGFFVTVTGVTNEMWVRMGLPICMFLRPHDRNETRRLPRRASGLEVELSKHHYFSAAISTTSPFDWFLANSVCRELILIWLPEELCRFHTSARKYCWP
jgi:hypothetical protein